MLSVRFLPYKNKQVKPIIVIKKPLNPVKIKQLKKIIIDVNQYGPKRAKLCPKDVSVKAMPIITQGNPVKMKERNSSARDKNAASFKIDLYLDL